MNYDDGGGDVYNSFKKVADEPKNYGRAGIT